jgi:hypothetical protein
MPIFCLMLAFIAYGQWNAITALGRHYGNWPGSFWRV